MPKKKTPYIYQSGDDPLKVAERYGTTPQELLAANPGGFPFSTGQTINIPQAYEYRQPVTTTPAQNNVGNFIPSATGTFLGGNLSAPTVNTGYTAIAPAAGVGGGRGTILPSNPTGSITSPNLDMRGRGYQAPAATPAGQTGSFLSGSGQNVASYYNQNIMALNTTTTAPVTPDFSNNDPGNTDYSNTRAAREYAAAGTAFVNQMRWDPQRKKYVSIGRLLKQGKLDLKGNWRKSTRRQRQGKRPQQKLAEEQKQDFTLANSFISFGVGSG